jgi:AcrR family transcriptional regulator
MSLRELKAERKRRDILRSAAHAFKKKGYSATTMEDIASELLMTQGSLYYYFKSKEEILFACHEYSMEHILTSLEWVSAADATAAAKIRTLVAEHVTVLMDDLQGSARSSAGESSRGSSCR